MLKAITKILALPRKPRVAFLLAHVPHVLLGIALVLLFTRLVPPDEYGRFSISLAFVNIAGAVFYGWLQVALVRLSGGTADSAGPRMQTILRALLLPVVPCAAVALILEHFSLLAEGGATAFATVGYSSSIAVSQLARGLSIPAAYGVMGFVRLALVLALAIVFTLREAAARSLLVAIGLGALTASVVGLWLLRRGIREASETGVMGSSDAKSRRESTRSMWRYGLLASPSLLIVILLLNTDRFLVGMLYDESVVAQYSAQTDVARQMVYPLISALGISIVPGALRIIRTEGLPTARDYVDKESSFVLYLMLPLMVLVTSFGTDIATLLLPPAYTHGASWVMRFSGLAALFLGWRLLRYDPVFHISQRPGLVGLSALAGFAGWLVAFVLLTPGFGTAGAAAAGWIGGAFAILFSHSAALRVLQYQIHLPVRPIMAIGIFSCLAWTGRSLLSGGKALSPLSMGIAISVLCLLTLLLLLRERKRGA